MTGGEFEQRLAALFRQLGYETQPTKASGDFGADLILTGNGERVVVQAKRWKDTVGVKGVQEAHAAISYYKARRAMVVTTGGFTRQAAELAKRTKVELWNRTRLVDALLETSVELPHPPSPPAPRYTVPGDFWPRLGFYLRTGMQAYPPGHVGLFSAWLQSVAAAGDDQIRAVGRTPTRSRSSGSRVRRYCDNCGKELRGRRRRWCSQRCAKQARSRWSW